MIGDERVGRPVDKRSVTVGAISSPWCTLLRKSLVEINGVVHEADFHSSQFPIHYRILVFPSQ